MNYELQDGQHGFLLARGGGGGSSSGGHSSSSGSHSSSSYHSSSSGGSSGGSDWWVVFLVFGIFGFVIVMLILASRKKGKATVAPVPAGFIDPSKDAKTTTQEKVNIEQAKKTFVAFQKAWQEFDLKKMKTITSPEYFKKMTLELNVLKNYDRKNIMDDVQIQGAYIFRMEDYSNGFVVFFQAKAKDQLVDTRTDLTIFTDTNPFSEIWTFVKSGKAFVLDKIDQTTAEAYKFDASIAQFSQANNFYYDPDFGWLMMPSRGAIFGPAGFGNADINNHVIGYYRDKIVEFYSYEPKAGTGLPPITVAQAVLPKRYDDILVTEKSWYGFKPKQKGLEKVETESNEFNKKFAIWAAKPDRATSFELLATNFMERIYALNYEINIEVVDNVLYLYSPGKGIDYQSMLDVLSWAFDEMKM